MNNIETSSLEAFTLAAQIEQVKAIILQMDMEYAESAAKTMQEQASFQDSAAVLNPNYNPDKSDLIRQQAHTLSLLCRFVAGLKECERMKEAVQKGDAARAEIQKLFW